MLRSIALAALVGASFVAADNLKCDLDNKCPESAPCCSQFGQCGVGAYCLGGCDPRMSFSLDACTPEPVCQDSTTKFTNLKSIVDINDYLGDPKDGTWIGQGDIKQYQDTALLTMPANSGGSLMSSSVYLWYGSVKAKMRTSRGKGVITAFILFSDVKDEIDYEWVGADLETAQTNYYFQGINDYTNSGNISVEDSFHVTHEYEIRWTPDEIEWLIDGVVGRTKERKDTWNETTQQWMFPQTPARVQLSLWPGGLATNPKGTVDWAGGVIDWNSEDIQKYGYYFAAIEEITISCYKTDTPPGTNSGKSYIYNDISGTNNTVEDTDKNTVLASLDNSGLNMGNPKAKSSSKPKTSANTVPFGNGSTGDHRTSDSDSNANSNSDSDSDSDSDSGSGGTSTSKPASGCDLNSFQAGCSGSSGSGSGGSGGNNGKSGGSRQSASALAIIIAGCALYWL